jgi:uncharacterized repeat protein (TIGR03803 family)
MYGTSSSGGTGYDGGTVFEMTPGSGGWRFSDLYDFCPVYRCLDGSGPDRVILDAHGDLYGTTGSGGEHDGGTVFELTRSPGGWGHDLLYSFRAKAYCRDGQGPVAGVIPDNAGNIYGTTFIGGTYGGGSVFRLKHASGGGWKESVLYSFCSAGFPLCRDGERPNAGVVSDNLGNLYGKTTVGGGHRCGETTCGTVFELTPSPGGR